MHTACMHHFLNLMAFSRDFLFLGPYHNHSERRSDQRPKDLNVWKCIHSLRLLESRERKRKPLMFRISQRQQPRARPSFSDVCWDETDESQESSRKSSVGGVCVLMHNNDCWLSSFRGRRFLNPPPQNLQLMILQLTQEPHYCCESTHQPSLVMWSECLILIPPN